MSGEATGPSAHAAFCRGERPDDVLLYLPDRSVGDTERLADRGHRVADGTVLVVPGERGRELLERAADVDPMALANAARDAEGAVDRDCTGGDCPAAGPGTDAHRAALVFAFAQSRTEHAGGRYAEGDVVHAYVVCECGTAYADRWVADAT